MYISLRTRCHVQVLLDDWAVIFLTFPPTSTGASFIVGQQQPCGEHDPVLTKPVFSQRFPNAIIMSLLVEHFSWQIWEKSYPAFSYVTSLNDFVALRMFCSWNICCISENNHAGPWFVVIRWALSRVGALSSRCPLSTSRKPACVGAFFLLGNTQYTKITSPTPSLHNK